MSLAAVKFKCEQLLKLYVSSCKTPVKVEHSHLATLVELNN